MYGRIKRCKNKTKTNIVKFEYTNNMLDNTKQIYK